ncbi:MAG: helix-turn-helix domain-containing protein [Bacilli bacterium]|nr:helix-turn-helix domain-containing protein [Bacilli bacterium]
MKDLGQKLKDAREKIGVTIEEAAEDLNLRPKQLENIEEGNLKAFNDVFYLKYFIRDYAKYLSLDYEKLVDEFNEFLFDYTSKIPVDAIKEANKKKKEPQKKIVSPYTMSKKRGLNISPVYIYIVIILIIALIIYMVIKQYGTDSFETNNLTNKVNYEIVEV